MLNLHLPGTPENFSKYCIIPPGNLEAEKCFPCIRRIQNWFHNDMFFRLVLFIFPIMFARVFLRNKHNRVKSFFGCIIFLLTLTKPNLLTKNDILKSTSEIFTYESIDACNLLHTSHIHNAFVFFALSKFKYGKKDSFFKLLLLLSGDISLNPGPSHINQILDNNEWNAFKAQGLHFIPTNINSLLPKIEELRCIACQSNAAVTGISESKLDNFIFDSEIEIDGYNTLRFDRNRHGGGVACYGRNGLSFTKRNYFPHDIENIFIEKFLPKTKQAYDSWYSLSTTLSNKLFMNNE